jgi:hypothetical protein
MAVTDQIKAALPDITLESVGTFVFGLFAFILFLLVAGGLTGIWLYFYIMKKKYNKIIRIFEKIDGRWRHTSSDTAMERQIGKGGDTVFHLRRLKKIVSRPTLQTGANTYWMARREDGELENIGLEDIDLALKEAKVSFTPNEIRYAKASLQDLIKSVYTKETWWQKYGNMVMSVVFIVLVTVLLLLIAGKLMQLTGSLNTILDRIAVMLEKVADLFSKIDNLCSTSGVRPT